MILTPVDDLNRVRAISRNSDETVDIDLDVPGNIPASGLSSSASLSLSLLLAIDASEVTVLIEDSGVPRTLANSAYNDRRASLARVAFQLGLPVADLASAGSLLPARAALGRLQKIHGGLRDARRRTT